jgi:4-hydroxy-tetrahydrodipicolinate synthase
MGIMAKVRKLEGIIPAVCVVYTDETCEMIDEDAYREHISNLLKHNVGALCCGGHAGETECMNREERMRVLRIMREEVNGKVPVVSGIIADSTKEAIELGLEAKKNGADAVLFSSPTIMCWDPATAGNFMVEHLVHFDKEVDIPIIMFGAPSPYISGSYNILPQTFKEIAERIQNVVACKITAFYDVGIFKEMTKVLKSVRDIGCLQACDGNLFGALLYGGDGNLSGAANFMVEEDVQIYKAIKAGDLARAKAVADRMDPVTDIVYGMRAGLSITYFHYRYKVATWLLGGIPRPYMRLPQMPIPEREIEMLRQALVKAGKHVVR